MPTIILIGNGGREHAITKALAKSPQTPKIINLASAKNPGLEKLCSQILIGDVMSHDWIKEQVKSIQPDLVIIGPDDPIGIGLADTIKELNVPVFAPNKNCAQLEGSKAFTRNLLKKYNIDGSPDFLVSIETQNQQERKDFYDKFNGQIVVKADGLLGGKGVLVAGDHFSTFQEAEDFAILSIDKFSRVVLEEKLVGEEFSQIAIVDGKTVLITPAIQDYKRAFDGDKGPNTGGMGTISDADHSLPFLKPQDIEAAKHITDQVMKAVGEETKTPFIGVMYGGFMKTLNGEIKLIEYNARFGDPEALNIMSLMESDFVKICQLATEQRLNEISEIKFQPLATVVKYLCPEGYPEDSVKNVSITIDSEAQDSDSSEYFFASVDQVDDQLLLKGSRAVGILGKGKSIEEARLNADLLIKYFHGPLFCRSDIGTQSMMDAKIKKFQ